MALVVLGIALAGFVVLIVIGVVSSFFSGRTSKRRYHQQIFHEDVDEPWGDYK